MTKPTRLLCLPLRINFSLKKHWQRLNKKADHTYTILETGSNQHLKLQGKNVKGGMIVLALDHIVIATHNPKEAARQFSQNHHVKIVAGGEHGSWGTYNYLAYFANDCYIEWLGVVNKEVAAQAKNPLIIQLVHSLETSQEGPIQFALRTNELAYFADYYLQASIQVTGPIPGNRKKPNGSSLSWNMLFPHADDSVPFLIEWKEGINLPDNPHSINPQTITEITSHLPVSTISVLYQVPAKKNIRLQNTQLQLESEKGLSFTIN